MATVNGTNYAKIGTGKISDYITRGQWGGNVKVQYDVYEASSLDAGDLIAMAKIPAGSTFLGGWLVHDAVHSGGSGGTLEVGDASDSDRFLAAVSGESAGTHELTAVDGVGYTFSSDTTIYVKNNTASATGTIKLIVLYASE